MTPTRAELIHELVNAAVAEGMRNSDIRNRIISLTRPEERREAIDYLKLIRTKRGEELNVFTGESNLSDGFRSRTPSINRPDPQSEVRPMPFANWPAEARGLARERIWTAFDELEADLDKRPTRTVIAARLHTSESTLRRAQRDLGIPGWPVPRHPVDLKDDRR